MFEVAVEIGTRKSSVDGLLGSSDTFTWRTDPKFMPPNVFPHDEAEYFSRSHGALHSVIEVSSFFLAFLRGNLIHDMTYLLIFHLCVINVSEHTEFQRL